jgi:glycerol kinase
VGMSAVDRRIAAQIAASTKWARTTSDERREATAPARRGLFAKFEREADPQGRMTDADRIKAAEHLMRAHMLRLSLARRRKQARQKPDTA